MNQITEYIAEINTRDYKNQCKYSKKKLLSYNSYNISRIIFFKTLHVIFNNIPHYLSKLTLKLMKRNDYVVIFGMSSMMIVILTMMMVS